MPVKYKSSFIALLDVVQNILNGSWKINIT